MNVFHILISNSILAIEMTSLRQVHSSFSSRLVHFLLILNDIIEKTLEAWMNFNFYYENFAVSNFLVSYFKLNK